MKRFNLLMLCLIIGMPCTPDLLAGDSTDKRMAPANLGLFYERANYDFQEMHSVGLSLEYFFSRYISINYRLALGWREDGSTQVHTPAGILLAGELFSQAFSDDDEDDGYAECDDYYDECECEEDYNADFLLVGVGLLSVLLPEGVSLHIYLSDWLRLSPFINPLGVEIISATGDTEAYTTFSSAVGTSIALLAESGLTLAAQFTFTSLYDSSEYGMSWGLGLSFPIR